MKHTHKELCEIMHELVMDNGTDAIAKALVEVCNKAGNKAYRDHGWSITGEQVARLWDCIACAFGKAIDAGRVTR